MNIIASTMSYAECYRINGSLPPERIEDLLDGKRVLDQIVSVPGELDEARGCFSGEDFAEKILKGLRELAKRVRGENRETLSGLIEELAQLQTTIAGQAEYGIEKIDSAREMVTSGK
ncbi:hypothetical protein [Paraburkholderia acidisoli]|uniref:Uncharacterized protein n=1 Tax=Paraburkholderia acidisoli TaxID=2571748 RepID=A0A7Z2GLM2_9BURK|nr:hypothetical protein [Paraburkholderia acidisoli]QGZ63775.1 hypothetical protein FAZ98_18620 [Paraburkholderia acidisoli]